MSTKTTIICGDPDRRPKPVQAGEPCYEMKSSADFHFYTEVGDDEYVHLELVRPLADYMATQHFVRVGIPCEVMDAIAQAWASHGRAMMDEQTALVEALEKKP